ncbi:MAG: SDR family oxidoreductase [Clostridia bacterium]|nr:SDR family oxidoreductase [Clostridia bacterium]
MKALITGASSGIGREIAILLDSMGIETVLVARREDKLKELADTLKTKPEIIPLDLSKPQAAKELYEKVPDIDILINNAGFGVFGEFDKTPLEREEELISLNVTALHILTKLYLKDFKEKNKGYILNVASIASFLPGPLFSSYYASKAYAMKLTTAIHHEQKRCRSKVKVSCLCPGPVVTEFNDVAGVSFGPLGMKADKVAKIAVKGMFKGKRLIIPGGLYKFARIFVRFIPERLCAKVMAELQLAKNPKR